MTEWCPYQIGKTVDGMFDTIRALDRWMDRRTEIPYHYDAAGCWDAIKT